MYPRVFVKKELIKGEGMKIDFRTILKSLETGMPIPDEDRDPATGELFSSKPFTLRTAAIRAILAAFPGEGEVKGEEKLRRYDLASRINAEDEIDLTAEDVAFLKERIAKMWPGSLIPGQAWKLLDPLPGPGAGEKDRK